MTLPALFRKMLTIAFATNALRMIMTLPRFSLLNATRLLAAAAAATVLHAAADQTAVGDDGREILLKENGTWEYKNQDRFGTSESGSRVRLKDNGSWEFVDNKVAPVPVVASKAKVAESTFVASNLNFELQDVAIHSKKNKIPNSNNYRVESKTQLDFKVVVSEVNKKALAINTKDISLFKVSDDIGKEYKVLSVKPSTASLKPGDSYTFSVMVDEAPKYGLFSLGGRVDEMYLEIDKSVFGTDADVKLTKSTEGIKEYVNGKLEEK